MRGNRVEKNKGKGTSVLAFFLGLLLGIIFMLGAIGGGIFLLLNADLNKVLGIVGLDNSVDENGEHRYVNTDPEDGGVTNLLELIAKISVMSGDYNNLTLGQIDDLMPITRGIVDQLIGPLSRYANVRYAELREVKFKNLGEYMDGVIMEIQPATIVEERGPVNPVLEILLCGIEADYVIAPSGEKYPLYVDKYVYDEETELYLRAEDMQPLNKSQEQYLVQESCDKDTFDLFFYNFEMPEIGVSHFIAERNPENVMQYFFTASTVEEAELHAYSYMYDVECAELTGNYYYDNDGVKVVVDPVTIGSLMDGTMGAFDKKLVLEFLTNSEEPDRLLHELLGDVTVGDFLSGKADMHERIENLELALLLDIKADEVLTSYIGYGITGVKYDGQADIWTAKYKLEDGTVADCVLDVDENGVICNVYCEIDGETVRLKSTTVGGISDRISHVTTDLTIGELIDIPNDTDNIILKAIMNSTIDGVDEAIKALTINELYFSEIYKLTVYVDADGDGKADANPDKKVDADKSKPAQLKKAVKSLDGIPVSERDNYEVFNPAYLYYVEVDGVFRLVNWDNETQEENANGDMRSNLGKLSDLPQDGVTYWTYGQSRSMWRLLLTDKIEVGGRTVYDERALALNDIASLITGLVSKLTHSTLRELDDAGILDFSDAALNKPVDGGLFGDLELDAALQLLVELLP